MFLLHFWRNPRSVRPQCDNADNACAHNAMQCRQCRRDNIRGRTERGRTRKGSPCTTLPCIPARSCCDVRAIPAYNADNADVTAQHAVLNSFRRVRGSEQVQGDLGRVKDRLQDLICSRIPSSRSGPQAPRASGGSGRRPGQLSTFPGDQERLGGRAHAVVQRRRAHVSTLDLRSTAASYPRRTSARRRREREPHSPFFC